MIAAIYGPCGIVTATASIDTFYEALPEGSGMEGVRPIRIEGLPHTYIFWDKYAFTYNLLDSFAYPSETPALLRQLEGRWESAPGIETFMPYLKKLIVDNKIQSIGVVSAYEAKDGVVYPYVYQVLGEDIRRINIDNVGNILFNCIYLEHEPRVAKLLHKVKMLNGNTWEETSEIKMRCDLFSIEKSIDTCAFLIKTNQYLANLNTNRYADPLDYDVVVCQPGKIEVSKYSI